MATYMTDIPRTANPDVCPVGQSSYTTDELYELFPNGVMSDNLLPDPDTNRIAPAMLQQHVRSLEDAGILKPRPTQKTGDQVETDMDSLIISDADMYSKLQEEYCFYEQRYRYGLKKFLELATSRVQSDNAEARSMLTSTIKLNRRLNCVIEVMNYIAQSRVDITNMNKEDINMRNKSINERLAAIQDVYAKLVKENAVIQSQKEMIRYTHEKNNHVTNQISVWVALNVLALATVFYVYRS